MRMNKRKTRSLKLCFLFLLPALALSVLVSCNDNVLSKRLARNAIEREAMFRDSSQVVKFDVGYYEIRPEMREALDTLVALGVINCKVEEVVEHRRFEKYTWWEGTKVYYKDVTHYFADVSLTESGEAYMVSDPPITRLGDDFTLSDSLLLSENSLFVQTDDETAADSVGAIEAPENDTDTVEKAKQNAYAVALDKVRYTSYWMLAGFYRVDKVGEVFCPPEYAKEGRGVCRFICRFTGLSPFGRVMTSHKEGETRKGRATLLHYLDEGWVVDFLSFDEY